MTLFNSRNFPKTVLTIAQIIVWAMLSITPSFGFNSRDTLWNIVSTCMDTGAADYCTACVAPRAEAGCDLPCRNTTQVWAESKRFVVIRDRKMCDCPEGFVHGLALPRNRVTGVEDPARPEDIWAYAWDVAERRMPENEIALAVNPERARNQDQLHVHIVKVVRETLPTNPEQVARVDSLGNVWYTAAGKAAQLGWKDYGVLVTRSPDNGYLVVIDDGSPEDKFTRATCR
jgi:CDP-diacylglycerol pyrophosphatase